MRVSTILVSLIIACAAMAQDSRSTVYNYDLNGRRVPVAELSKGDTATTERVAAVNGRRVPTERTEEQVLEKDSTHSIIERTVRRFDQNGNPLPPEKVRLETTTRPDGSSETKTTVFRGDVNGNLALAERSVSETREAGGVQQTQTRVERPTVNGGLEMVERQVGEARKSGTTSENDLTTFRRDANGRFVETNRKVVRAVENGPTTTDEYESATTGHLQLSRQTVARTVKSDDTERQEVFVYGPAAPGRAIEGSLKLREEQVIEVKKTNQGTVESFSIRRPSLNSSKELGPLEKISETVCTGKCK